VGSPRKLLTKIPGNNILNSKFKMQIDLAPRGRGPKKGEILK
jgi:hypothetical protein